MAIPNPGGSLNLPDSDRAKVYRVVKAAVQADAAYEDARVTLVFPDGDPESIRDLDSIQGPALLFFPACARQAWFDEGSQSGAVEFLVEARLPTLNVEDVFNLQAQIEATLNTIDDPTGLQSDLVDAGAVTGLVLFTQPLRPISGKAGEDHLFRLSGQFVVEVRRALRP